MNSSFIIQHYPSEYSLNPANRITSMIPILGNRTDSGMVPHTRPQHLHSSGYFHPWPSSEHKWQPGLNIYAFQASIIFKCNSAKLCSCNFVPPVLAQLSMCHQFSNRYGKSVKSSLILKSNIPTCRNAIGCIGKGANVIYLTTSL